MTTLSRPPADPSAPRPGARARFRSWQLFGLQDGKGIHQGPGAVGHAHLKKHSWWQVMCLTGVDYFSTLGYQPSIAGPDHLARQPLHGGGHCLLVFPKLALGLSGFETGVAVMPQIHGRPGDTDEYPAGRIEGTRKLLTTAAVIMSSFLVTTSLTTVILIPAHEFEPGGQANGRALAFLAFLAQEYPGNGFGTVYDVSTVAILWFAGASAMAGLLNLVPRYLPRYGMAPEWARAVRPLVLLFTLTGLLVTYLFEADVDAQGDAYATGVLVLMTSAAVAVTLSARRRQQHGRTLGFGTIAVLFIYTTVANIFERPEGTSGT